LARTLSMDCAIRRIDRFVDHLMGSDLQIRCASWLHGNAKIRLDDFGSHLANYDGGMIFWDRFDWTMTGGRDLP
jgi:hypothetical protein